MATPAGRLIQDRNLNSHSTAFLGGKADASKSTKKGALGGRRALNDISNSGKPSGVLPSAKNKSINVVVPTGKDAGASKANSSKNQEKGKSSGRKALSDLTNTVKKTPLQHISTKSQDKKLSVPSAIKEEGFLHNHEECLKAQRKTMSLDYFLETVGLADGSSVVLKESLELKPESPPVELLEMDDMPMMLNDDAVDESWQTKFLDSPRWEPAYGNWKDVDFLDLKLIESPKALKCSSEAGFPETFIW